MIERYSRPEMARLWSQDAKYDAWLKVELAVCEVYAKRGVIPADALGRIKAKARVDAPRRDRLLDQPRGVHRRRLALRPRRHDLVRCSRHGARAPAPAGLRRSAR